MLALKCLVLCQCVRHETTECQSVVRLADGTTWYNSIVVGWFLLLGKQIFMFFRVARTQKDGTWEIFNMNWAWGQFLLKKSFYLHMYCLGTTYR